MFLCTELMFQGVAINLTAKRVIRLAPPLVNSEWVLGPETSAADKEAFTARFGVPIFEGYGSTENAIILDRAGIRAGARSFALAHELGHVLLDMPGHPDDYGVDWNQELETGGNLIGDRVRFTANISAVRAG